jgi:putative RNA 2'-phosphotransferase
VESILEHGLNKQDRHHVHLSSNIETAEIVGKRKGKPVIFKILSKEMFEDGYKFYLSENNVWLTDNVPVKYLEII